MCNSMELKTLFMVLPTWSPSLYFLFVSAGGFFPVQFMVQFKKYSTFLNDC